MHSKLMNLITILIVTNPQKIITQLYSSPCSKECHFQLIVLFLRPANSFFGSLSALIYLSLENPPVHYTAQHQTADRHSY